MKALTEKDLPVLADIIREAIYREYKVYIRENHIFVRVNGQLIAIVVIRDGGAYSTKEINKIPMKHCDYLYRRSDFRILI